MHQHNTSAFPFCAFCASSRQGIDLPQKGTKIAKNAMGYVRILESVMSRPAFVFDSCGY
jgi:hypothetical protein